MDVTSVDPGTILFCEVVEPTCSYVEDDEQVLKVKFDWAEIQELLGESNVLKPGRVEVFVNGKFILRVASMASVRMAGGCSGGLLPQKEVQHE